MQESKPQGGNPEAREMYEHSDVGMRPVLIFVFSLVVIGILAYILLWGLFHAFEARARAHQPKLPPLLEKTQPPESLAQQERLQQQIERFPEPRLQYDDVGDMNRLRLHEAELLGIAPPPGMKESYEHDNVPRYAWVDRDTGVVRIPIDRAIQLIAQRGLPVAAGVPPKYPPPPLTRGNIVEESRPSTHVPKT